MKVAEGNVNDSPFARTIFSLAANRFTGDLLMIQKGKEYRSSWEGGWLVAATSPSPADSEGRVALAGGMVNSTTLGMIANKLVTTKEDPLVLITEIAKLNPEQVTTLKFQILARRAARIFGLPRADYVLDNARSMRADPQLPSLDIRWLIYFGLRSHYTRSRLQQDLAQVGERTLQLQVDALPMLPAYGFTAVETPILELLKSAPLSLGNLLNVSQAVDKATAMCVIYSLMACGYIQFGVEQEREVTLVNQIPTSPTKTRARSKRPSRKIPPRPKTAPAITIKPKVDRSEEAKKFALHVEKKCKELGKANHYQLLGLRQGASDADIRKAYFSQARKLHPDRLHALGLRHLNKEVQELFSAINKAFSVLSKSEKKTDYDEILAAGGEKARAKQIRAAEEVAIKALRAEEHFYLGEMALKRDQFSQAKNELKKAMDLVPGEAEYQALFSWAYLCSEQDRAKASVFAMQIMSSAVKLKPNNGLIIFHQAKMLKLLGHRSKALEVFKKALKLDPKNRDAKLEIRLLS